MTRLTDTGRVPTVHDFGRRYPKPDQLSPYQQGVDRNLFVNRNTREISYGHAARYLKLTQQYGFTPEGRDLRLLEKDVDVIDTNGRIGLDELALYDYRLDQAGNADGVVSAGERQIGRGLSDKNYLLEQADALGTWSIFRNELEGRLAANTFTVSTPRIEDAFDLSMAQRDELNGAKKAGLTAETYDRLAKTLANIPEKKRNSLLAAVLGILGKDGNLPALAEYDRSTGKLALHQHRVAANIRYSRQGQTDHYVTQRRLVTNLKRKNPVLKERAFPLKGRHKHYVPLVDPATYTHDQPGISKEMDFLAQDVMAALSKPHAQRALKRLYEYAPQLVEDAEGLAEFVTPVARLLARGFDVSEQEIRIRRLEDRPEIRGRYRYNGLGRKLTRLFRSDVPRDAGKGGVITLNQFALEQRVKDLKARNQPAEVIRREVSGQLLNTLAHEMTHAWQHERTDRLKSNRNKLHPTAKQVLKGRFKDYQKVHKVPCGWERAWYIPGDRRYYLDQPTEVDARQMGDTISRQVLEQLTGRG